MFRRTTSKQFVSPLADEINRLAKGAGLENYSPDLVRDLSALQQGEELLPLPEIEQLVRAETKPQRSEDGKKWSSTRSWTTDYQKAMNDAVNWKMQEETQAHSFLSNIDPSGWEGQTPLDKAINFMKYLQAQDKLNEQGDLCSMNGRDAEQANDHFKSKQEMGGDGASKDLMDGLPEVLNDIAEVQTTQIWKIAQTLDTHVELRRGNYSHFIPDKEGRETRIRPMQTMTELMNAVPQFWALPQIARNLAIVQQTVMVREKVSRDSRKQLIAILIDISGSMRKRYETNKGIIENFPIRLAIGVFLNRIKAAYNEQAEVYYAFFESRLTFEDSFFANDKESAKKALKNVADNAFNGGGTSIDSSLHAYRNRLAELHEGSYKLPEIVIITDGNDTVYENSLTKALYPFTLHAFIVGANRNPSLANVARRTGGLVIEEFMGGYTYLGEDE